MPKGSLWCLGSCDPSVTTGPVVGSRKSYPDLDGLASARVPSFLLPNGTYSGTGVWKVTYDRGPGPAATPESEAMQSHSAVMWLQQTAAERVALNTDGWLPATDDGRCRRRVRLSLSRVY